MDYICVCEQVYHCLCAAAGAITGVVLGCVAGAAILLAALFAGIYRFYGRATPYTRYYAHPVHLHDCSINEALSSSTLQAYSSAVPLVCIYKYNA